MKNPDTGIIDIKKVYKSSIKKFKYRHKIKYSTHNKKTK